MNRAKLLEHARSVKEHAEIVERFLIDSEVAEHGVALEVLGRCNLIDARVVQIRSEMASEDSLASNVHVLGDRPSTGDAA